MSRSTFGRLWSSGHAYLLTGEREPRSCRTSLADLINTLCWLCVVFIASETDEVKPAQADDSGWGYLLNLIRYDGLLPQQSNCWLSQRFDSNQLPWKTTPLCLGHTGTAGTGWHNEAKMLSVHRVSVAGQSVQQQSPTLKLIWPLGRRLVCILCRK